MTLRLLTFDALFTLLRPSLPIHQQYVITFQPYFGSLDPEAVTLSFKRALKDVQSAHPSYSSGHRPFWAAVIDRCARHAGVPSPLVQKHLDVVTDKLLHRFSSNEGYELYPDVLPTFEALKEHDITLGVVTNSDIRMNQVLASLSLTPYLAFTLTSEQEGVQKPHPEIFSRALSAPSHKLKLKLKLKPEEVLHVGDELLCDYEGARSAGMQALLLRRPVSEDGPGVPVPREEGELPSGVKTIGSLREILPFVLQQRH